MSRISIRKIRLCAANEYFKWMTDARMIVFAALLVFIHGFVLQPMLDLADRMESSFHIAEPFIAVCNVPLVMLAIPLVFLVLICDFPRTDNNTMFYIIRIGRMNWVIAQVVLLIAQIVSYMLCLLLFTVLTTFWKCSWSGGWSDIALQYTLKYPMEAGSFTAQLLTGNLYRQLTLGGAVLHSAALISLCLMLVGMLQLAAGVLKLKRIGFILSAALVAVGQALAFIGAQWEWCFPVAHALVKLHFTDYFRAPVMPLSASYFYFAILIVLLGAVSVWRIRYYNYDSILEVQS